MPRVNARRLFERHLWRIRRHARVVFRHVKCFHRKADCLAEVEGLSWKWFQKLHQDGRHPERFISRIADFACRAVKSGRRVCGQKTGKDVMNEHMQAKHGYYVGKLPDVSHLSDNPIEEALHDNTQTPPDEQAIFRLSFPVWLNRYRHRDQRIALAMMEGHRTKDISAMFDLSQGRISQLRDQFYRDWSSL